MAEPGFYMPVPGEDNAPTFDPSHPLQIHQYFAQLKCLFIWASLTHDQQEMKFYTTFFIDPNLADLGKLSQMLRMH
jgi:cytochrome c oxidase assembly protein Cox11